MSDDNVARFLAKYSKMAHICHQDIVPEMCVGGAPVYLSPFGPGKEISIAAAAHMEAVDIGMDPSCEGSAQGNDAAPVIFCVPGGDCPQWVVKISYPEIQCLRKPAACAAEEPEQDGVHGVPERVWCLGIGIDRFQEPPALIFRINMGDMVACRVFCPDVRQICMVPPLFHEFSKPVQQDFLVMERPVRPSLPIDKGFRHLPGQCPAFISIIKAEMVKMPEEPFLLFKLQPCQMVHFNKGFHQAGKAAFPFVVTHHRHPLPPRGPGMRPGQGHTCADAPRQLSGRFLSS